MYYKLKLTNAFKHDLKTVRKQGKKLKNLETVVDLLVSGATLPDKYRNHQLSGDYTGFYECHIEPDWLLIYFFDNEVLTLTLTRTGSHSELFN